MKIFSSLLTTTLFSSCVTATSLQAQDMTAFPGADPLVCQDEDTMRTQGHPTATVDLAQRTENGGCSTCRRCQVNGPTGALDRAYHLDARK